VRGEGELGSVVGGVDMLLVQCYESIVVCGVNAVDSAKWWDLYTSA
jgi:hypothetical protein